MRCVALPHRLLIKRMSCMPATALSDDCSLYQADIKLPTYFLRVGLSQLYSSAGLSSPRADSISPSALALAHDPPSSLWNSQAETLLGPVWAWPGVLPSAPIPQENRTGKAGLSCFSSTLHPRVLCCTFKSLQPACESGLDGEQRRSVTEGK